MKSDDMLFNWDIRHATAAFILIALQIGAARGELTLNLRFADGSQEKTIQPSDIGDNLEIDVWAAVTNTGGVNGQGIHEGFKFAHYSVISNRLLAGPSGSVDGGIIDRQLLEPFTSAAQQGRIQDLNADGILDLGSLSSASNSDFVVARSQTTTWDDSPGATSQSIPNGWEFLLQRLTFRIDNVPINPLAGGGTTLAVIVPSWSGGALPGANWFQDSAKLQVPEDGLNTGFFLAGTRVTLIPVPEPSGIQLLAGSVIAMIVQSFLSRRSRHVWKKS